MWDKVRYNDLFSHIIINLKGYNINLSVPDMTLLDLVSYSLTFHKDS